MRQKLIGETIGIRCTQNSLFACGKLATIPVVSRVTVGESATVVSAHGPCTHCGLPLTKVQTYR